MRLTARDPNYGFGILLLFVVFEFEFSSVSMLFAQEVLRALAWSATLVGNILATSKTKPSEGKSISGALWLTPLRCPGGSPIGDRCNARGIFWDHLQRQ